MNKVCSEGRPPLGKQRKGSGFVGPKGLTKSFPVLHSRLDESVRKCGVFFQVLDLSRGPRATWHCGRSKESKMVKGNTKTMWKLYKVLVKNLWAERRLKRGGGTLYFRGRSHSNLLKPWWSGLKTSFLSGGPVLRTTWTQPDGVVENCK